MIGTFKTMVMLSVFPLLLLVVADYSPSRMVTLLCIQHVVVATSSSSSASDDKSFHRSRVASSSSSSSSSNTFYQRYEAYPPYCGDPTEMATRSIPPLVPPQHKAARRRMDDSEGRPTTTTVNTQLVHVTAIIRHGARTPANNSHQCWDGHWDGPDGIWDCDLKTLLTTQPPTEAGVGGYFVVEKIYDAFDRGGDDLSLEYKNRLNGTCQMGQLIQQGYDQHVINGQFLRQAYIYNGTSTSIGTNHSDVHSDDNHQQQQEQQPPSNDPRMRLWDTSAILSATSTSSSTASIPLDDYPFSSRHLRYRSDDDQRTLASGQVLLTSMFGPELQKAYRDHDSIVIPHHTADRPVDILSPRKEVCSSIREAAKRAEQSAEYQAYNNSHNAVQMRQLVHDHLAVDGAKQDCLMTTICTDRTLPDVIDDYTGEGSNDVSGDGVGHNDDKYTKLYGANRFVRLRNYAIEGDAIIHMYNDSEYSKLAMAPLWAEIMDYITPVITRRSDDGTDNGNIKFALYSGHDATIIPLMASLGPRVWNKTNFPYYASMMLLEIHEVLDDDNHEGDEDAPLFPSGYAFRLVYNGKVMTGLIDGCSDSSSSSSSGKDHQPHLCDIKVLTDRVSQFATRTNAGCGEQTTATTSNPDVGADVVDGKESNSPTLPSMWMTALQTSSETNPRLLLAVSIVVSFVFCSMITCLVVRCTQRRRPRLKQRAESELVMIGDDDDDGDYNIDRRNGCEDASSDRIETMMDDPDIVID